MLECINATAATTRKNRFVGYALIIGPIIIGIIVLGLCGINNYQVKSFAMFFSGMSIGISFHYFSAAFQVPLVGRYLKKKEIEDRLEAIKHG